MTTVAEARELLRYLTPEERAEVDELLAQDMDHTVWRAVPGPQQMAYDSVADIVGYGGAAGGGKTDLIAGLTQRHRRCLVARREKAQTEGFVQRMSELLGGTDGLNSQKGIWWLPKPKGTLVELAGLDNPGDEKRWQGRAHDLKAFDEVTEMRQEQVRFVMGWTRTSDPTIKPKVLMTFNPPTDVEGRWVVDFFGPWLDKRHPLYPTMPGKIRWCAMLPDKDGRYKDQWLPDGREFVLLPDGTLSYEFDREAYSPEQIIQPKSRTFIPARLTDNPYYMATNYMSTLQSLPEPLRSRMLYGDFQAGIEDSEWQVIPTVWVEKAQARWHPRSPKGEQLSLGVDVARGGKDRTTVAPRYRTVDGTTDWWFDELKSWPGTETPNGPIVAGYTIAARRDDAPIHVDVIGVGAAVFDVLNQMSLPVYGVNVAEKATTTDKSGRLTFFNLRSQLVWRMRELLDPEADNGIALPPDPELVRELCAFHWKVSGFQVKVSSREELFEELGLSVDKAWAVILSTIETPKISRLQMARGRSQVLDYDPVDREDQTTHDPFA